MSRPAQRLVVLLVAVVALVGACSGPRVTPGSVAAVPTSRVPPALLLAATPAPTATARTFVPAPTATALAAAPPATKPAATGVPSTPSPTR